MSVTKMAGKPKYCTQKLKFGIVGTSGGASRTLSERQDVPHLPVLAQQDCQLLYTPVLFSAGDTDIGRSAPTRGSVDFSKKD